MPYHHVLLRFKEQPYKDCCMFSDLNESQLREQFVEPYQSGKNFPCGTELIDVSRICKATIVRTDEPCESELKKLKEEHGREIDEFNRTSSNCAIVLSEDAYPPEEIVDAGVDVTSTFIPPPSDDGLTFHRPYLAAIVMGLIVAALVWLFFNCTWRIRSSWAGVGAC